MNILFVSGHDPREKSFGSPQRTNMLWRALQQIGDVYAICYYSSNNRLTDRIVSSRFASPKGWKGLVNRVFNKFWFLFDKDALKMYPFGYEFTFEQPFGDIKFDAVVCRYMEPAAMMHLWNIAPLYVDFDDDPIQAFKTRDGLRLPKWKRPIALLLLKMIVWIVKHKMTAGWIANPKQASVTKKRPILPLHNIPKYPSASYNPQAQREQYIFSVGYMGYAPNYLGVDAFIQNIWEPLHQQYPELQYLIVGKGAPKAYEEKWKRTEGVRYLGFVEDLEAIYEKVLATVVAVEGGSGTCIKTLESLAHSRVCLSTPFGVRGMKPYEGMDQIGVFVYHTVNDFILLFQKYITDTSNRLKIELISNNYCSSNYSISNFNEEVQNLVLGYKNDKA